MVTTCFLIHWSATATVCSILPSPVIMTRTKKHTSSSGRRPVSLKRPTSKKAVAVVVVLSAEQKVKRSLGRSVLQRGRLPVVMDGSSSCNIAKMGRRRMAANILSELSPNQHMMIRPSITTTTARAIECVLGSIAEKSQGWNAMHKGTMLMAPHLLRAFIDYCTAKGGVWLDVIDEVNLIRDTIIENKLEQHDDAVMAAYASTEEGVKRREARLVSSKKAQLTKKKNKV